MPPSAWSIPSSETTVQNASPTCAETSAPDTGEATFAPSLSPETNSRQLQTDIDRLRDFEARIAQATAQLKTTPSVRTKRRPSTKSGAMSIGTPTLINSSANIKVTPIPLSQLELGNASSRPNATGHTRHQSSSALPGEKGSGGGVLKGFVAKIKRNASLADRKRPKASVSPRTPQDKFQPFAAMSPVKSSGGSEMPRTGPVQALPAMQTPSTSTDLSAGRPIPPEPEMPSRKSLVRRTIILSNPSDADMEDMPSLDVPPAENSDLGRRPSTRRKPVRHLSGDTEIFRAEGLLSAESQSISQVMSTSGNENINHRKSATDSLYDMYTNDSNQEEQDQEEVIYSGASASFEDDMHPELYGLSHSTKPRAIEIR